MDERTVTAFRACLAQLPEGDVEGLLGVLPENFARAVRDSPSVSLQGKDFSPLSWVHSEHYTWLSDVLSDCPQAELPFFLACLPEDLGKKVAEQMGVPAPSFNLGSSAREYFSAELLRYCTDLPALPPAFCSGAPFQRVMQFEKGAVLKLIDVLGIQELIQQSRKTVDKRVLQKLIQSLSSWKGKYFQEAGKKGHGLSVKPGKSLSDWSGDAKELNRMIHDWGLLRLGLTLKNGPEEFAWKMVHILDVGRAKAIESAILGPKIPDKVLKVLREELLKAAKFIEETLS